MDSSRFDTLARSLTTPTAAGSRRRALAALSSALGLALGASSLGEVAAKTKGKKKKKGKKKRGQPPASQPPASQPVNPCANAVKDGDETDVDCGGSCGPCANEQRCRNFTDCQSALCAPDGTCVSCMDLAGECPSDRFGRCHCQNNGRCTSSRHTGVNNCNECPANTERCFPMDANPPFACRHLCGTL